MKPLALILALAPAALAAQPLPEQLATAPNISEAEWRSMTNGKTVVYQIDGETYGYESYRGDNNVTIQLEDGTCIDGTWYMQQTAFCFDWQGGPLNCFNHKRFNGEVYVVGLEDGVETEDIQKVARIGTRPVACGPALLSALTTEAHP